MTAPVLATSRADLAAAVAQLRARGRTVGLVPTMGALHAAHRTLVDLAGELSDDVVVSIFVNPLQFGPAEDFARYPRNLDQDLRTCAEAGVAVVFAPTVEQMYGPGGEPSVRVDAGPLGKELEGAARPGHFDGVLTAVLKLFGLIRPDVAVFGRKDAQQLALVRRMVRDLDVPVRVVGAPVVREPGGLAMSSRNRYLDAAARAAGSALWRALSAGAAAAVAGATSGQLLHAAGAVLASEPGLDVDYCRLVDAETFADLDVAGSPADGLLLVAGRVGSTRLIDNTLIADATRATADPSPPGAET
jgi:pantoate--beta-alanine ligase